MSVMRCPVVHGKDGGGVGRYGAPHCTRVEVARVSLAGGIYGSVSQQREWSPGASVGVSRRDNLLAKESRGDRGGLQAGRSVRKGQRVPHLVVAGKFSLECGDRAETSQVATCEGG